MKKTITVIGVLVALWVGYDQVINNKRVDIQDTERRNRDSEREQQKKIEELEREYDRKVAEIENRVNQYDIKEVVDNTKDTYVEQLAVQKQQLEKLQNENEGLENEVQIQADSIKRLIVEKEGLLNRIKEQDNIIAQKDSLIAFYKSEIETLRTRSKEIFELLREATTLEIEGDNMSSFWNRKNKQDRYYSAWLIYKKLWKNYGLLSAEESFHSTWTKLKNLGVDLDAENQ